MNKTITEQFIPYDKVLILQELGFKDECLAYYDDKKELTFFFMAGNGYIDAPLYQQAFDFLLRRLEQDYSIKLYADGSGCVGLSYYFRTTHMYNNDSDEWEDISFNNKLHCLNILLRL